jgi:uncharacterized protein YggE
MMLHFRSIARFVPAVLLASGGLQVHAAEDKPQVRTISVSGQGRVSAAPNRAEISVGVVSRAATAREALAENNQRTTALHQLLKDRGIAAKDVQTSQFAVYPLPSQPQQYQAPQPPGESAPKIPGYQVHNTVRVTVRDLTKLGLLLDSVVAGGANQVYGVSLRSDDETLLCEARKRAMADARKKAALLAGEAELDLGPPISIREEAGPYSYGYLAAPAPPPGALAMATPAASVPVAPGEQETSVTVHVVYELKTPR